MNDELTSLREFFEANRSKWIAEGHEGQWCALGQDFVPSFHATYQDAFEAGSKRFGQSAFLLQEVLIQEPIEQIQLLSWSDCS